MSLGIMVIRTWGRGFALLLLAALALVAGCSPSSDGQAVVRVGYFPNLTHAQAVIGVADGTFARALGDKVHVDAKVFNAGPSVIEAIFAGQLDMAYIGPNPAVNGYVKSKGSALRIIAGAASGGAVLVVRGDAGIHSAADFEGKKIASPQLGNTQDVALRAWLAGQGFKLKEQGGNTAVIPTANPDILTLFLKKEMDAAWVPEPWGARLVQEAGGQVFLDERDLWPNREFTTACVIVRKKFLDEHPDLVKAWLAAHLELTWRITADPAAAKQAINREIARLTSQELPPAVLDEAWSRETVTYNPVRSSLLSSADAAFKLGFLGDAPPNLDNLYDLTLLNQVLKEKGLAEIQ